MAEINISDLPTKLQAARDCGSKYYYTGKPCKRGHLSVRRSSNGICLGCDGKYHIRPDGQDAKYKREAFLRNPEKIRKQKKESHKKWRQLNKEKINAYTKNRRMTDPNYKMATVLRSRLRKLLKGKAKKENTINLLGCTVEEVVLWIESKFKEGMSWDNHGLSGWHLDHIRPLASFDLTDEKQIKIAFHYTNLQPLWWHENLSKGADHMGKTYKIFKKREKK